MTWNKKVLLCLMALTMVFASVTLIFVSVHSTLAQQQAATLTKSDFPIPAGNDPWGTAFDSQGNVWLAIPSCDPSPMCSTSTPPGKLAVFNPGTSSWSATYQLPSGYAQPLFLAFDGNGNVWFPMPMNNALGMYNPGLHTFQQWSVPTPGSGPWDVAIDHNGKIWFTEHYTNKIGSFDPITHIFKEIATPASNSQPYGITVDGNNNVWFTENNSSVARIAEYTPAGKLLEYKVRSTSASGLTPHLLTVDANGNIWWSEGFVGMIGELQVKLAAPGTTNGVTEHAYPQSCQTCGTHTSGISTDKNGLVWFDDSLQSIFGSFPQSGTGSFATYGSPSPNSHPHDGLNVDGLNRIWFDEEFGNKLALAWSGTISTPTPTPTTTTPTPTPTPGAVLATDTFQRANQTFWGTASDGHAWGGDANNLNVFSIVSNTGHIANGSTSYSAVLGPPTTNAEILLSGSLSSFNSTSTNIGGVLRWKDGNNWYKAYIDGSNNLVVQKKVNGSTTILGTAPFSPKAGTSYTLRFRVSGSTLSAKVWQTGSTEPTSWMVTVTDSSLPSGFCGLRMLVQSGVVATYTSFQATSV
jgi:streptogramin lyase